MAKLLLVALLALAATATAKSNFREFIVKHREPNPAPESPLPKEITLNTITQHVDNFNTQNHDTWEQRYYQNTEFYRPGGPIYIYLGGEWRISPGQVTESLMMTMAEQMFGMGFYLEHRYYGESFPTEDVSDANLRFLTPDQALADIAHFIDFIEDTVEGAEDSEIIVIGAHYSGSLAMWFRQKYPHLVLAAWASSAPAIGIFNHNEYKVNSGATYRRIGGNECYDAIEDGFEEMEEMVRDGELEELSEIFDLCQTLESDGDIATFFALVSEFYSLIPQFSNVNYVNYVCNLVRSDEEDTAAERVALIIKEFFTEECIEIDYELFVENDREFDLDDYTVVTGIRQATYQQCTQLGWHHTSDRNDQPYGSSFPLDFFVQACEDVFTDVFDNATTHQNIDRLNVQNGGFEPEVTNVIFTQGAIDPWISVGIQEDLNDDAPAIVIYDGSQASDLTAITDEDSWELITAKWDIMRTLRIWIARANGVEVVPPE